MKSLGWEGKGLGKEGQGVVFPVQATGQGSKRGFGGELEEHVVKAARTEGCYVCRICDVECSGSSAYAQHVQGRQHARKARIVELAVPDSTNLHLRHCIICDVECSGEESYALHLQGRSHLRRLERRGLAPVAARPPSPDSRSTVPLYTPAMVAPLGVSSDSISGVLSDSISEFGRAFKPSLAGHEEQCLDPDSPDSSHCAGTAHEGIGGRCEELSGLGRQARRAQPPSWRAPSAPQPSPTLPDPAAHVLTLHVVPPSKLHTLKGAELRPPLSHHTPYGLQEASPVPTLVAPRFAQAIRFNAPQHESLIFTAQAPAQTRSGLESQSHVLTCTLCNIDCSGKEQMQQHLVGKAHLRRITRAQYQ
jgi:hypothetical protein